MYQALYRKWRPKTFNDVVGQEHISETLKRQVVTGRLSHAYLFVGTRGTGKTSCAKILSRAINCTAPNDGNPCNKCASCLGIENGSIMDVLELDAASNNGVDNVRALREEAVFTPVDVKKRVYIIDEVHMLSSAAFNALLKILEEPPEHLIFILATTEIHKVPATILSRCQRFTFKRILPSIIAGRLCHIAEQEGITLTADASDLLARLSDGSLRDALSLLDQCASSDLVDTARVLSAIGLAGSSEIASIIDAVAENDAAGALELLDKLYTGGKVMASVLEELSNLVRDVLIISLMPKGGNGLLSGGFDNDVLQSLKKRFTADELLSVMSILKETSQDLSKSSGGKLDVELCLMRLCDKRLGSDVSSMLQRIAHLEEQITRGGFQVRSANEPTAQIEKTARRENNSVSKPTSDIAPAPEARPMPEMRPSVNASPVIDNAPDKEPQQKSIGASGDIWKDILSYIKPNIDPPPYTYLSDTSQTNVIIEEGTITVQTKNAFIGSIINVPAVNAALKDAALTIMKKPVIIRIVQEGDSSGGSGEKLDALSRFSNIKFE